MSLERQTLFRSPPPFPHNVRSKQIAIPAINFVSTVKVLTVPQDTKYLCGCSKESSGHNSVECSTAPPAHGEAFKRDFTFSIARSMTTLLQCKATKWTNFLTMTVVFQYA